jgi:ATP-binding cassette subfamily F protein uup
MSLISARGMQKAYGPQVLLKDVTLTIEKEDRIGLLGVNGAGKSTLLKILAGVETVDEGVIDRGSGSRILYLSQEPELPQDQTPTQIVLAGLGEWSRAREAYDQASADYMAAGDDAEAADRALHTQAHLGEEIERLGGWERGHLALDMLQKLGVREVDRVVNDMSGGERRRVALAQLLVAAPDLAILDEPTNHLDVEVIEWLETYLADEFPGAVLLVTHDRYALDAMATRIFELERGTLHEYRGDYSDYLEQKADRLEHESRVEDNRLNFVRRERAWLSRGPKARSTKQKARIQRAEKAIAVKGPQAEGRAQLVAAAVRSGKTILELQKAGYSLPAGEDGTPGRRLFAELDMILVAGDRVGIVGPNGSGKTTLLHLVTEELAPTSGKVVVGKNTRIAYFDQARAGLEDGWSIFDNVAGREGAEHTGGGMVEIGAEKIELRSYLERFLFDKSKQRQKVSALSGGERARVALAKLLREGANLLLLDEPTNDLDVTTLGALEEMLEGWPGCALIVSHDRAFLDRVATSVLAFEPNTATPLRYAGGYSAWRDRKEENEMMRRSQPPPSGRGATGAGGAATAPAAKAAPAKDAARAAASPAPAAKALKPLSFKERKELESLVTKVEEADAKVADLEKQLADPKLWAERPGDAAPLQAKLDEARKQASKLTTRWEELETRSSAT